MCYAVSHSASKTTLLYTALLTWVESHAEWPMRSSQIGEANEYPQSFSIGIDTSTSTEITYLQYRSIPC